MHIQSSLYSVFQSWLYNTTTTKRRWYFWVDFDQTSTLIISLLEYVCGDEVNKDIDRKAVYLNTTYYPIDVDTEVKGISDFLFWLFSKNSKRLFIYNLEQNLTVGAPLAYLLQ